MSLHRKPRNTPQIALVWVRHGTQSIAAAYAKSSASDLRTIHMRNDNVIPFPKRPAPPSEAELERYRLATRNWHPEFRRRFFPEHYELELTYAED
jgi:hypothetical protein